MRGVVAAGHPLTAEAGADVLRAGGNAVDAALAAMLTSFVAEPLLTGLGAGGYMLVAAPGARAGAARLLRRGARPRCDPAARAPLVPVDVSFGDAVQVFNVGAASCGVYGTPAGVCAARRRASARCRWPSSRRPLRARPRGRALTAEQAYLYEILSPIYASTPEARALFMPEGPSPRDGDVLRDPELADALERLGAEGAAPFYAGDIAAAVVELRRERGGMLTREDLAAYAAVAREPVRVAYRGREVLTNPPPSAGGIAPRLRARAARARGRRRPTRSALVAAMEGAQAERTPEFLDGLAEPGLPRRFLASRLGITTHISVLDADGWACAVTCTNGEGSGVVVPGTGVHLNNMMGEQDLSPLGFFTHPPGRRLPSMMAPTVVLARRRARSSCSARPARTASARRSCR